MKIEKKYSSVVLILFVMFFFSADLVAQKHLSYIDLVKRLYDLEYLATLPSQGEKSGTFSSYDRASKYDKNSDSYIEWDANHDGSGYIRKEGEDIVIFEDMGTGVIWRIWSALASEGHIKIYIDNDNNPVVDKPFKELFEVFPAVDAINIMNFPNLVYTLSRGRNHFLPIAYNKYCKIVLSPGWGAYYHITYSNFQNVSVQSFTDSYSRQENIFLAETDRFLGNRGYSRKKYDNEKREIIPITVPSDKDVTVKILEGKKAITYLTLEPADRFAEIGPELLNDLWLSITWDNDSHSAVLSPIGKFFGAYNENHNYRSLPLGIIGNQFYSNWYMPFAEKASIKLINKGDKDMDIVMSLVFKNIDESPADLLRFNARWFEEDHFEKGQKEKGKEIDWVFFKTDGIGRYCGVTFFVDNRWEEPDLPANTWWYGAWDKKNIDWWWGDGDEKFFVDGEKFPSTFGTGSEDYIGYAWSAEPPFPTFDSPFASQPSTPINGNGFTVVNRFQIADNIPFHKSFTGCLERYKKGQVTNSHNCFITATVYWYQK